MMRNFALLSALLFCSWISASVSQTQTVKVQPGENVMLQCSNRSSYQTYSFWSRLNKTQSSCISSLYDSENNVLFCDGFENDKYEVKTNISTIFLTINKVDVSDSGLYFCGIHVAGHAILTAIDLIVEGMEEPYLASEVRCKQDPDEVTKLIAVILGVVTGVLVMVVIGLAVKHWRLQKAHNRQNKNPEELKEEAVRLNSKADRSRKPKSDTDLELNVMNAATT
ncbi:uncharacterized protein LOC115059188 isoform X2 [Echeneis naucrates]|uniref:uncharacterized protein LOC115059188 isoform X2 n=1 Tax=Echeneis naucrates TaxID=173247 RepID=UPI001113D791|nr:uncharacterized protein LOC115059188 isoform X2 [Echeneis naucrates]